MFNYCQNKTISIIYLQNVPYSSAKFVIALVQYHISLQGSTLYLSKPYVKFPTYLHLLYTLTIAPLDQFYQPIYSPTPPDYLFNKYPGLSVTHVLHH